jgi:hypothetical protein
MPGGAGGASRRQQAREAPGKLAVVVTMHGKRAAIEPPLAALGLRFSHSPPIDTARFGTFSREVARAGTQRETLMFSAWRHLADFARPAGAHGQPISGDSRVRRLVTRMGGRKAAWGGRQLSGRRYTNAWQRSGSPKK